MQSILKQTYYDMKIKEQYNKRSISIFLSLLLSFFLVIVLTSSISGLTYFNYSKKIIQESINKTITDKITEAKTKFNFLYENPIHYDLSYLESSPGLNNFLKAPRKEHIIIKPDIENLFLRLSKNRQIYMSIRYIDSEGYEQIIVSKNRREKAYSSIFDLSQNNPSRIETATLYKILERKPPGSIIITAPFKTKEGKYTVLAGVSKSDPEINEFGGTVIFQCDLSNFFSILNDIRILNHSFIWIFGRQNEVYSSPADTTISPDPRPYLKINLSNDLIIHQFKFRAAETKEVLFHLVFSIPRKHIEEKPRDIASRGMWIILGIFFLSSLIALYISRVFSNPVKELSKWGQKTAEGNLSSLNTSSKISEIIDLCRNFSNLSESLLKVADLCDSVSKHDFTKSVELKSNKDVLGQSVNKMVTALKNASKENERKINYLNDIPTPLHVIDPHMNIVFINRAGAKILGLNGDDCVGKKCYDLFNTKNCHIDKCMAVKSMNSKKVFTCDNEANLPSGNLPIRYTTSPVTDEAGTITGAMSYIIDISDEIKVVKLAERVSAGEYFININKRSKDDRLSSALNKMTGKLRDISEKQEMENWLKTGENRLYNIIRGEQNIDEIAEKSIDFLARYLEAKKGSFIYVDETGLLIPYGNYPEGRHEKAVRVGNDKDIPQKVLFDKKPVIINNSLSSKDSSNDVGAITGNLIFFPLVFEEKALGLIQLESISEFTEIKLGLLEKASSIIAIAVASSISRERLKVLLDKTRKQQDDLKKINRELELSGIYKSEFMANISHELRTPLNSLLILAKLLMKNDLKNLTDDQIKTCEVIYNSGQDLLSLINNILDLSKIESGKSEISLNDIDLMKLTENLEYQFKPVARDKNIEFKTFISSEIPIFIKSDNHKLEQILRNLISNAIKFTSKGSVSLRIHIKDNDADPEDSSDTRDKAICFSVADTGIGIPKQKQTMIFAAFQQADGSTERKYGGTGLGLSISKKLTYLLGGKLKVKSEAGKGSIFTLTLPSAYSPPIIEDANYPEPDYISDFTDSDENIPDRSVIVEPDIPLRIKSEVLKNKKVLIVDDDVRNTFALSKILEDCKMNVVMADNGHTALQKLRKISTPDVIIMDIMMPVLNGYETIQQIRETNNLKNIPIISLTANGVKSVEEKCFESGSTGFLTKPVEPDKLITMIKNCL